jgi:hypothetical protein
MSKLVQNRGADGVRLFVEVLVVKKSRLRTAMSVVEPLVSGGPSFVCPFRLIIVSSSCLSCVRGCLTAT